MASECAPVHDAVLIEAPISSIEEVCARAQCLLEEASSSVLDGFRLRSDVDVICFPDRYMDERGERMWSRISEVLTQLEVSCEGGLPMFEINTIQMPTGLTGSATSESTPLPRHKSGQHFLKGPVPLDWLCVASRRCGKGSGFTVGIIIWFLCG